MPHIETEKIKIRSQTGDKVNDVLKDCYFYPTATTGVYDFFLERLSTPLARAISSGGAFTFPLGTFSWVIPNPSDTAHPLEITGSGATASATGSYLNNDTRRVHKRLGEPGEGDDVTGESGTFQAQAGTGGGREEEASAANA